MTAPLAAALLSEILSISADAIICIDRDQRITFYNDGAEQIFGYGTDEVLGQPLDMLIPLGARAAHGRHIEQFRDEPVRARRMAERQEIAGRRKSGEEFPAEAAIAKLGHGADIMYSVVLRDVTERRRTESALQRAIAARDDTLSVVAHDLRNPVSAVKMLAGSLLDQNSPTPLDADLAEHVRVIQMASEQMDGLIRDLLDMSRAEAGRFEVEAHPAAAGPLLSDALRTLAPLAAAKQIQLESRWDASLPDVLADPERVTQVMSNIVGNAIKFTPAGGTVTVRAIAQGNHVQVSVADSGPGIPGEHLEHIFDRYWQSSRRRGGAGLGLPIAKAIVEAHGGRIWAENSVGSGAVLCFTLPTDSL